MFFCKKTLYRFYVGSYLQFYIAIVLRMSFVQDWVSNVKVYISGLPWRIRNNDLREIFSEFGEVVYAKVILNKETGKSRGIGFVEFKDEESAQKAINEANGADLDGRTIKVELAFFKKKEEWTSAPAESASTPVSDNQ